MFRFRPLVLALVLALAFAATLPAALPVHAADAPPAMTKVIYLAVFGVVFDEKADVKSLRLVKVVEPRKGNADAPDVKIPDAYIESVRKMLASPRFKPRPDAIKPDEVFTYFFFDPDRPNRADLDPRPRRQQ